MGQLACFRRSEDAFLKNGFRSWHKALQKFKDHEMSKIHESAVEGIESTKKQNTTQIMLLSAKTKEQNEARVALGRIFESVRYLLTQGLPFRRREEETGNLQRLIKTLATHCPELQNWLTRESGRTYLSHQVQTEMAEMLAHATLRQILSAVREDSDGNRRPFALMVDETTDASRVTQVSICVRYVDDQFTIHERFVGLYSTEATTSQALTNIIKDAMIRMNLSLDDLRGQCYDGAANMAGKINGVQAQIKALQPKALYVHCTAHRLQLAVQDAMTTVRELQDALGEVSRLIEFFRNSPKRLACLKGTGASSSLQPLCPTRWTCCEPALRSVLENWAAIRAALQEIGDDPSTAMEAGSTAAGFARNMDSFGFWFGVSLASLLFAMTNPVAKAVQSSSATVASNIRLVKHLEEAVRARRDKFQAFWDSSTAQSAELDIEPPRLKRATRPPRRLDGGAPPHHPASAEDAYRRIFYAAVDSLAATLRSRYESGDESLLATAEEALLTGGRAATQETARVFGLNHSRLSLHVEMLRDICSRRGSRVSNMRDMMELLLGDPTLLDLLPEVSQLVRLMLTVPATSCASERSFSLLRRLKSYLRTTISQTRLNYAAVCATYGEELSELNLSGLVAEFSRRSPQRVRLFGAA